MEGEKETDKYNVVSDGIHGLTRKTLQNGLLEFKNLKINRRGTTDSHQLLILAFFITEETPKNRQYYDVFLSDKVSIYTEGEILLIDKVEGLMSYFQLFEADAFDKPLKPKTDCVES